MTDVFDRAQERDEQFREAALARQRTLSPKGPSAEICADCEEPIPEERRRAAPGCTRCIDCQRIQDRALLA